MKKLGIAIIVVLLIGAGGFAASRIFHTFPDTTVIPEEPANEDVAKKQKETKPEAIRLLATGDMIAHDSINANAKQADGSYDYASLMSDMHQYFNKGDINFCNQSTPAGGESFGITGYPIFNAPIAFPRGLEEIGCNLVTIGSNHTNDKGQELVDASVAAWDDRDVLAVAGANRSPEEQAKPRIFEIKGMKFAFVAYTDYTNSELPNNYGVNVYSPDFAASQIDAVRGDVDFVIASIRWGTEYSPEVNNRQDQVAQELADAGADVLLGHGPHVLEPVKRIQAADGREVYVWFSLGDFLNSQLNVEERVGGFASMTIDTSTHKITEVSFLPVYQHYEWSETDKAAENLLARKNFKMLPLDQSSELLRKSLLETTVEEQTKRVTEVLNRYTEVPVITSEEF